MADGISTDLLPRAESHCGFRYEEQKWTVWRQEQKNMTLSKQGIAQLGYAGLLETYEQSAPFGIAGIPRAPILC